MSGRKRRKARLGPSTRSERGNALALWKRALALGAGWRVADAKGLPPRPMAAMLLRAARTRLQGHLLVPLRFDDRFLVRIVTMKENQLIRRAERAAARAEARANRQIPPQD